MSTSNQNLFAALRSAFPADLEQIAVETMSASGEPIIAPDPTDTVARHEAEMAAEAEAD